MKYFFFPSFLFEKDGKISPTQSLELVKQFEASSDEEALERIEKIGPGILLKEISWIEILRGNGLHEK